MGRVWEQPAGNLAMSGLVRPQPGEGPLAELGFVAALALHDLVAGLVEPARLQLKWPNDLLLDGAKLSGILLEREGDILILGIGVNVAAAPEIAGRATVALADVGVQVTAAALAKGVADAFARRRADWAAGGFAGVRAAWLDCAHPIGTLLWVITGDDRIEGRFAGLSETGALLLDVASGARHVVHAGDVWGAPPTGEGEG